MERSGLLSAWAACSVALLLITGCAEVAPAEEAEHWPCRDLSILATEADRTRFLERVYKEEEWQRHKAEEAVADHGAGSAEAEQANALATDTRRITAHCVDAYLQAFGFPTADQGRTAVMGTLTILGRSEVEVRKRWAPTVVKAVGAGSLTQAEALPFLRGLLPADALQELVGLPAEQAFDRVVKALGVQ